VLDGELPFSFLAPDYVLVVRQGALWAAQQLDIEAAQMQGEAIPVAPRIFADA
jgi:hypothetical protein